MEYAKPVFTKSNTIFYKEVAENVKRYLSEKKYGRYAHAWYWIKITIIFGLWFWSVYSLYAGALYPFFAYAAYGIATVLMVFNVSHDASHNSIASHKGINRLLFTSSFMLAGLSPRQWRHRHLTEHHPFPNVPHRDPDLISTRFLRFSPSQEWRSYHRCQAVYAVFIYCFYTLFWIVIKDFARQEGDKVNRIQRLIFNFFLKTGYITLLAFGPSFFNGYSIYANLFSFLFIHMIISLWIVFTFLISHYIEGVEEPDIKANYINTSWEMHQLNSSVDFHATSKIALFIFGGFNCHVAHHLFPAVSHVHYPAITRIIRQQLEQKKITWHEVNFIQGIKLHFQRLYRMGRKK